MKRAFDTIAMQAIKINELEKELSRIKMIKGNLTWHEHFKFNYLIEQILEGESKKLVVNQEVVFNLVKELGVFCLYLKYQKEVHRK